jgi:hypothetical protein
VVNNLAGGNMGVLLGNGDGTFQTVIPSNLAPTGVAAVGDFDGDGILDLLEFGNENASPQLSPAI